MRQLLRHDDLVDIALPTPVLIIPGDNLNKAFAHQFLRRSLHCTFRKSHFLRHARHRPEGAVRFSVGFGLQEIKKFQSSHRKH